MNTYNIYLCNEYCSEMQYNKEGNLYETEGRINVPFFVIYIVIITEGRETATPPPKKAKKKKVSARKRGSIIGDIPLLLHSASGRDGVRYDGIRVRNICRKARVERGAVVGRHTLQALRPGGPVGP
jgi:hypothetical protein